MRHGDPERRTPKPGGSGTEALRVEIRGAVQGVGFRPFVFRLAAELELAGWVRNDSRGVFIHLEGPRPRLRRFLDRVAGEAPPRARVQSIDAKGVEPDLLEGFHIRLSDGGGDKTVIVLPDIAPCDDCMREVGDPHDRRRGYPFTNCTNCGPRFSIVRSLPYDRPNTSMSGFRMCPECRLEYDDPHDRRFHAQPNACPVCGPRIQIVDAHGRALEEGEAALDIAVDTLDAGRIVALKGLGGFHLMVDACSVEAVQRLRRRKHRPHKPLAVMVAGVDAAATEVEISDLARELLTSPEAPIVLLPRRPPSRIVAEVAPGNPYVGLMLPSTPLHHLLMRRVARPLVATSGNLSDEPICIDNAEALARLGDIADLFLAHDRPVVRHVDDSVVRIVDDAPQPLRRARGLAPLPVVLAAAGPPILAVGGHLKNTVALAVGDQVFVSQHVGDMETPEARRAFER